MNGCIDKTPLALEPSEKDVAGRGKTGRRFNVLTNGKGIPPAKVSSDANTHDA